MNYGEKIKRLRMQAGLTQAVMAREAGITQPHLSLIESGNTNGSIATLRAIAKILGVSLVELFDESEE